MWVKETPTEEGWYWIKYKGGRRQNVVCPCYVTIVMGHTTLVDTARRDNFVEGPNHGGPGMKYKGKLDKSVRFGNKIPEPDY